MFNLTVFFTETVNLTIKLAVLIFISVNLTVIFDVQFLHLPKMTVKYYSWF